MLVEHARLTGRVLPDPLSQADTHRLAAATSAPGAPTTSGAFDDSEVDAYRDWPGDIEDPQYRYCDHPLCDCEPWRAQMWLEEGYVDYLGGPFTPAGIAAGQQHDAAMANRITAGWDDADDPSWP